MNVWQQKQQPIYACTHSKSQQQTRLPDSRVTDEEQFEQVITKTKKNNSNTLNTPFWGSIYTFWHLQVKWVTMTFLIPNDVSLRTVSIYYWSYTILNYLYL